MCGLTLSVHRYPLAPDHEAVLQSLCSACATRGPDTQSTYRTIIGLEHEDQVEVVLCASVLGLRGGVVQQPLVGKRGILGWNGQVFDGLDVGGGNDTALLFDKLEQGADPLELLAEVEGPYAMIYLDLIAQKIYFQLDPLSRRSLLIHLPDTNAGHAAAVLDIGIEPFPGLMLTSVRSSAAREHGVAFRALGGGEGGILDVRQICPVAAANKQTLNFASAMHSWVSRSGGSFTHLSPVNTALPDFGPGKPTEAEVGAFITQLQRSVDRRINNIPVFQTGVPRVAVLFSGGVDCSLLAALLHRCLPSEEPVDLINVAFAPQGSTTYQTPDRLSGIEAWAELQDACPRDWRLVTVDVPFEQCQEHRQAVLDLMYPSSTEMDLSLAFPLYFASRGLGRLYGQDEPYRIRAKVYLSGLGADEQLGGYSRHRHAFKQNSWQGLIDETQMDITRLPTRNLSRDDRIISSHARDARYPYLDLSFVSYLSSLPIWTKCNPSFGEGAGDKMLLRLAAKKVGLEHTSARVKRAMQFGTRSSKMSVSKGPKAGERMVNESG